mmetsp:Transcript_6544/g.27521  ORF Transcript_6544/g.27521 Transcript_6544/m.27521 type:complete len:220 (+) Transcript_6544:640-1299(+)
MDGGRWVLLDASGRDPWSRPRRAGPCARRGLLESAATSTGPPPSPRPPPGHTPTSVPSPHLPLGVDDDDAAAAALDDDGAAEGAAAAAAEGAAPAAAALSAAAALLPIVEADVSNAARFAAMMALTPPLSFRRAFHCFMFSMVDFKSVVESSVACLVNHWCCIEAAADGLLEGSTWRRERMKFLACGETLVQNRSSKSYLPALMLAYMAETPLASSKGG